MKALQGLEGKQLYVLDALRYSFLSERYAYSRLNRSFRSIERRVKVGVPESMALGALTSAWQIIDFVYRARGLFREVRGLRQKDPECQLFLRATDPVEELRQFFQHLNSSISGLNTKSYPIMGALSWVSRNPVMSYTLSVGHWTTDLHSHSMVVDLWERKFVASIQLNAASSSVELALVHAATRKASAFLESWLSHKGYLRTTDTQPTVMGFGIAL